MKSFALLAPAALLSSAVLVAALPSHPRRDLQARNRVFDKTAVAAQIADADASEARVKRFVQREAREEGGELVKRKQKTTTSEWRLSPFVDFLSGRARY